MKLVDLDDEAIPLAEIKSKSDDNKYFITAKLVKSQRGHQLLLYAGERGKPKKAHLFIEPDIKRMDFDRKDIHPTDIFLEVKATFKDGSSYLIDRSKK